MDDENEERNSSNNSTDILAEDSQILFAVILLLLSLCCLFMIIYLSIRLKKRAWDSPAKRFANIFNVCFALLALCVAVYSSFTGVLSGIVLPVLLFFSLADYLYFSAMYVALSLQIVTPFLPKRLKLYARKTRCVKFTEVTSHILFLLLALSYSICACSNQKIADFLYYAIYVVMGSIIIVFILSYSFIFLVFVILIRFFKYHNKMRKGVKYMIIKLLFLFIVCITFLITFILALYLYHRLKLRFWSILLTALHWEIYFILSISVVSLNHPMDIWCCKCCFRKSPSRIQLLPVTEGQQTNPVSVWDHRNVPSYTVTNLPYDMSDCRSDYEQCA